MPVADTPKTGRSRATWTGVALLVAILMSIGTIWIARRAVGVDTDRLAETAVEMALAQRPPSSPEASEQMRSQMLPFMRGMIALYPVTVPVGVLLSTVVIGTLLMGAYRMFGVPVRWPMSFAACAVGAAASALVRFCVTLLVVFVFRRPISAESFLDNSIVPLNVAAFLSAETGAVWRSVASKLDLTLFVFVLAVVSYLVDEEGFARERGQVVGATLATYALWIVLGMAWAAAWSGFGR